MLDTLDNLFIEETARLHLIQSRRSISTRNGLSLVLDNIDAAVCLSVRVSREEPAFCLDGDYRLVRCHAGGWLLQNHALDSPSYWLPAPAMRRRVSNQGHILEECLAEWGDFSIDGGGVSITFTPPPEGWVLDAVIWRLDDAALIDELQTLAPVEIQGYFLPGSHTRYNKPADLYRHLIHGWVYEDRYAWPHKRRICSENDAHALHLVFSGLKRTTGKRIYELLKNQLLLSVLSRQGEDGSFRHGEWTEGMESHYRLHCSAMHLMMDALSETNDPVIQTALTHGIHFISSKYDSTDAGAWFYHDELECSLTEMQRAPFKWWPGNALGKSPQNMLVLNTQLDTLVALERYGSLTGDTQYAPLVESGYQAASTVLALRPMEWLYRLLFSAIDLTLLPTEQASRLPMWQRLWKRIGWQMFVPRLPRLKTRYPRLVMPGGYVDRELSLQTWAYDYLAINLMDLVRAAHGTHRATLMPYIQGILDYCARTSIARRWLEHKGRTYSVGFYAEALYLLCLQEPSPELDASLADALLLCVRNQLGLPPSLLGGNAEANGMAQGQQDIPQSTLPEIVIANLSNNKQAACVIVNTGQHAIALKTALCAVPTGWHIPANILPPGAHLRIQA